MQKKIIALAVAAAFSTPALADVAFYGIVDAAVANISADGQKSDLLAASGGASQSRLGVKATEDLGNGLTGVAVLEYGLDSQDNSSIGNARQKMLAVAGDFGTVATGYLQTAAYDFLAKYDPIYGSSSSAHSIVASGHLVGNGAQRAQRAVAYISPDMGGLTVAVNYATALTGLGALTNASTNSYEKDTAFLVSGNYVMDALSVGAVYASFNAGSNAAATASAAATAGANGLKASEFAFGGSYDLGMAKVMGTYQSFKADTAGAKANTVFSLAGVMPVSTGAIAVMYGSSSNAEDSALGATALTAGYLHTFSKTTTGYVVYSTVSNGSGNHGYSVYGNALAATTGAWGAAASTVNNGASSSLIGAGLRKKF